MQLGLVAAAWHLTGGRLLVDGLVASSVLAEAGRGKK